MKIKDDYYNKQKPPTVKQTARSSSATRPVNPQQATYNPLANRADNPFQKALDATTLRPSTPSMQASESSSQPATERAAPQVTEQFKEENKQEDAPRRQSSHDKEDVKETDSSKESGSRHAKVAEQRVTGRPDLGQRKGSGKEQQGEQHQGAFGNQKGRVFDQVLQKSGFRKGQAPESLKEAAFLKNMQEIQKTHEMPPTKINRDMMNQLVAYVQVLMRKGEEKEVQITLREKFFQGLKMKVTKQDGKLMVTFLTSSPEVHSLFSREKGRLADALAEKNVEVGSIAVIMA